MPYYQLDCDIIIPPVEMIICQAASNFTLAQTAVLVMEMCGTYSISKSSISNSTQTFQTKAVYNIKPVTSIKSLRSFLALKQNMHMRISGCQKVAQVLKYCAEGSASPQESRLFCKLHMPYHLGGYGIKDLHLNYPLVIRNRGKSGINFVADFCIPDSKLILEYDSDEFHFDYKKFNKDTERRDALTSAG